MKRLAIVALSAVLGACASNDAIELEPAELVDFDELVELKEVWSEDIGSGQDERYTKLIPAISGDRIYATDIEGNVQALDRLNGDDIWEAELDAPVSGGVGAGFGLVLVGTYAGEVIALDQASGEERWRAELSSEVLSAPQTNGDVVVAQTLDGKLYALDAASGEQRWSYDNPLPVLTLRGTATPVVTETMVFAGFASGKVLAIDAKTGLLRWEQRVALAQGRSELERVVDIDGSPLLVGDILYTGSYQGRVMALNRGSGRGIWVKQASTHQDLSAGGGKLYVALANDHVVAYEAGNGQALWTNDQLVRRAITAPQAFGGYVAVADFEGYVHVMSQSDGRFVARDKVDGAGVRSAMVTSGELLYVLGNSGELVALKIADN